jgi:lanosterol synthase
MNGYNSSALWDTAFAIKAILETPYAAQYGEALRAAYGYLRDNQVLADPPDRERYFRHAARGGWPFSDREHGWPITDCTSEGLQCALALEDQMADPIPPHRLRDSVRLLLSWQNRDGGWATYERRRSGRWLERLNPSQFFRDIMVDYSHAECTSACLQGLCAAHRRFPGELDGEIRHALARGERFLRRRQRADGSWEGAWGVCFTYGTWFGVWGLRAVGAGEHDPAVQRACAFLLAHQGADGGWGEDYRSCLERRWIPHRESQAVNTAWALLTLAQAGRGGSEPAASAARFLAGLQGLQQEDGDWPRQSMPGVFNRTTLIEYDSYRRIFPLWALARFAKVTRP